MRVSNLFGETLRDMPADTEIVSHQTMLRAGYIRQLGAGIFSYLPLARRSIRKIEAVLREEMDAIGGQEINMPVVHPAELWQKTGRWDTIDDSLVRFKDRRGHDMVLAMTHEEVAADLTRTEIKSYKQLPALIYHIQTKFRDEARARGGLIRVREFVMKDSYSLDRDEDGLRLQYSNHYRAYFRIGLRVGLNLLAVGGDVGMMGGKVAHEFMYLTPIGEDSLVVCPACGYAANQEAAVFAKSPNLDVDDKPLEKVATPGASTIADLSTFLGITPAGTCKAVFFVAEFGASSSSKLVTALVRGDMDANPVLVKNHCGALNLRAAQPEEIVAAGMVPGYASPVGVAPGATLVIVDEAVAQAGGLVAGANDAGYHLLNVKCGRDFHPDIVANIALAVDGLACIHCGKPLAIQRGVEVGNIFQLGTRYSAALGATFLDETGVQKPVIMGSYGIGLGRLLACIAEEYRDDRGLKLPMSVAPFQVNLVSLCRTPEGQQRAEALYQEFLKAGIEVLFDDRKDASAGVKFADSELRGVPLQVVISERSMQNGGVEWKLRTSDDRSIIPLAMAVQTVKDEITRQLNDLNTGLADVPGWNG